MTDATAIILILGILGLVDGFELGTAFALGHGPSYATIIFTVLFLVAFVMSLFLTIKES